MGQCALCSVLKSRDWRHGARAATARSCADLCSGWREDSLHPWLLLCGGAAGHSYRGLILLLPRYSSTTQSVYSIIPGIRYAEPPIGQLRLSLPVRREAGLEAELDVSGISEVVCPQWGADLTSILGQEDCLLLNVYVPGIKHLTRL